MASQDPGRRVQGRCEGRSAAGRWRPKCAGSLIAMMAAKEPGADADSSTCGGRSAAGRCRPKWEGSLIAMMAAKDPGVGAPSPACAGREPMDDARTTAASSARHIECVDIVGTSQSNSMVCVAARIGPAKAQCGAARKTSRRDHQTYRRRRAVWRYSGRTRYQPASRSRATWKRPAVSIAEGIRAVIAGRNVGGRSPV